MKLKNLVNEPHEKKTSKRTVKHSSIEKAIELSKLHKDLKPIKYDFK